MTRGTIAHNVSRGAFWLGVEKAAAVVSGMLYFALLLHWLGRTKYGIMTLALAYTGFAITGTGNTEMFLERYAAEYEARGMVRSLRSAHLLALGLKLVLGLLAGLTLIALAPVLAERNHMDELRILLPLLALMVIFDGLSTTGRATLYGLQRYRWVSAIAVAFHVAKIGLVGGLWMALRSGRYVSRTEGLAELAIGLALLTVIQGAVSSAIPLWMMRNARDPEGVARPGLRARLREMVTYCLPLLGGRVTFTSGQNLVKIVLGALFGPEMLGLFAYAFQFIDRFVDLTSAVSSSLLPSFTQLVARGERDRLAAVFDQSHRLIQIGACALSVVLFLSAREVTLLVAGHHFEAAIPLVRILALVPIARTAHQPLTMLFQAMRRPGTVFGLAVLKFVTEFGSYFALVPMLKLAGAGWSNLIGATVTYGAALVVLARLLPEGAGERARTVALSLLVTVPILLLGLMLELSARPALSLVLRLALLPLAGMAVVAFGLVNRYDLTKLSALPMRGVWMARVRDGGVGAIDALARAFEPGAPGQRSALRWILGAAFAVLVLIGIEFWWRRVL